MDILKLEIRGSQHVLLSVTVAASVLFWSWTLWRSRNAPEEKRGAVVDPSVFHAIRSPGSPRTRAAFKKRACTCKLISTKDDCRQNKQKNTWLGSDEEETDTDANLLPSSMRSKKEIMLNR